MASRNAIALGALLVGSCTRAPGSAGDGFADGEATGGGSSADGSTETSASASASGGPESTTDASTSSDDGGVDGWDFPSTPDVPIDCDIGERLSYIWIANSDEGTISKLNTVTLVEEGRYIVRPDAAGSPSRTSVNLSGDVAVANRNGGVTKVRALAQACPEKNGIPGIQTSSGPDDVLPWGEDDCVDWYTAFDYPAQRPVAWTTGTLDESTCERHGEKVWTSGAGYELGTLEIVRLSGDDGVVENVIPVPSVDPTSWGAYGGAVDGDGNFYLSFYGGQRAFLRADFDTLTVDEFELPIEVGYGITVGPEAAYVCGSGVARFDIETETWTHALHDTLPLHSGPIYAGCMVDGDLVWVGLMGPGNPVRAVDGDTLEIVAEIPLPMHAHGISIDLHGYVWGVTVGDTAYRIDPATKAFESYVGLDGAYTYSDMTGVALLAVAAG